MSGRSPNSCLIKSTVVVQCFQNLTLNLPKPVRPPGSLTGQLKFADPSSMTHKLEKRMTILFYELLERSSLYPHGCTLYTDSFWLNHGATWFFHFMMVQKWCVFNKKKKKHTLNSDHFPGLGVCCRMLSGGAGQWQKSAAPSQPSVHKGEKWMFYGALWAHLR